MVHLFGILSPGQSGGETPLGQRPFFGRPWLFEPDDAPGRAERDAVLLRSGDSLERDEDRDEPRFVTLFFPPYF